MDPAGFLALRGHVRGFMPYIFWQIKHVLFVPIDWV